MLTDHIVFPGALSDIIEEFSLVIANTTPKSREKNGAGKNVEIEFYGGGYVSIIEENSFYYFTRANNLNFGYNINSVEALRLEKYKKGGSFSVRKELNHFYQNYTDRKLLGIINMNEGFDPNEKGGKICLFEGLKKRSYIDNIFYEKSGSMVVFNTFTGYRIEEVLSDELKYLYCFCVGDKWK